MALQDLTPQLRTRLSRVERVVGLFVTLATLLLVAGFVFYVYQTAKRKGWFLTKIHYSTCVDNAAGLKVGDPVRLMGFEVGEITRVEANGPYEYYNVTVFFRIKKPYYGYLWSDSKVRVASADLLGNRYLEVIKGIDGLPTVLEQENAAVGLLDFKHLEKIREDARQRIRDSQPSGEKKPTTRELEAAVKDAVHQHFAANMAAFYIPLESNPVYWFEPDESPALSERLEKVANAIEDALPNVLALTNLLYDAFENANTAVTNLNQLVSNAQPIATNLAQITSQISDPRGSLGEWLIPTNLHAQLNLSLASLNTTLTNTDANLTAVAEGLDQTFINLAAITSNLNAQVQANTNVLGEISDAIVHADEFVQGLKRHWLLRSAFRTKPEKKDPVEEPAPGIPSDRPIPTRGGGLN